MSELSQTLRNLDSNVVQDTNKDDMDTFIRVVHFPSVSYANNVALNGIIHLYSVADTRLTGSAKRNMELMKRICGTDAYPSVHMVLNMWFPDEASLEHKKQRARERQLEEEYIIDMHLGDGRIHRLMASVKQSQRRAAARHVLTKDMGHRPITLQIQAEMVDEGWPLSTTSAGMFLTNKLRTDRSRYKSQMTMLQESLKSARLSKDENSPVSGSGNQQQQVEHRSRLEALLRSSQESQKKLELSLIEIHKREHETAMKSIRDLEVKMKGALRLKEEEAARNAEEERKWAARLEVAKKEDDATSKSLAAHVRQEALQNAEKQRIEPQALRKTTIRNLQSTQKVKNMWVDPVVSGTLSGGMGIGK